MSGTEQPAATVPLYCPSTSQMRAGAVWVTISNWADALAARYGAAEIVTPAGSSTPAATRAAAWSGGSATAVAATTAPVARTTTPKQLARTLAKDLRWALWSADAARRARSADLARFAGAPFVWQHHDLFERPGLVAARRLGLPLVLFVDAPQVWEASRWGVARPGWGGLLERIAERPQFLAADAVACVSDEVAEAVAAITGGAARVLVTPCTAAPPANDRRAEHRARLGLDGRFVVGWVGSFRPFHHADMLVEAVATVAAERQRSGADDVTLMMIGDGPTRAACEAQAAALGLDARFVGRVGNEEVVGLLQACDAGAVPAQVGDSFHYSPLKLKEFLAAGLPTVVPRAGEMARTLDDGTEALLVEPGDTAALAAQLARLAADRSLAAAIGRAGAERLASSFSIGDQLDAVEELVASRR